MSSATAPARASSPQHDPPGPVAGSGRFDSPGHHLLPARSARRSPCVVIGLVMVLSASSIVVHRHDGVGLLDLPQPGGLRGWSAPSRSSSPRGCRCGLEAPGAADPRCRVRAAAARAHARWASASTATRTGCGSARSRVQPSEIVKLGLVARRCDSSWPRSASCLHSPRATCSCPTSCRSPPSASASSCSGHDLGTVLILMAIVAGVLFAAGIPLRWFAFAGLPFAAMAIAFVVTSPNRLGRIDVWLGRDTNEFGAGLPADPRPLRPGRRRLVRRRARGEPGEVGPAARGRTTTSSSRSSARSSGCPARSPSSLLFAGAGAGLLPPRRRAPTTSSCGSRRPAIMTWIIVQALINIGAVIGLLPGHRRAAAAGVVGRVRAHHDACSPSASCSPSRAPNPAAPRRCRRDPRPCAARWRSSPASRARAGRAHDPGGSPVGAPRGGRHGRARLAAAGPGRLPAPPRPRGVGHRARHRHRARGPARARARATRCSRCPRCRSRADPPATCSACRRNLRRAVRAAEDAIDEHRGRGRRRLRWLRLDARLPRGPAPRHPDRRPRAERPPGAGQPARGPVRRRRRRHLPRHQAAPRHRHRDAAAPRDRDARPRRPPGRGAGAVRADRRPDAARHRRLARCPAAQRRLRRRRSRRCRRRGSRCCTSRARARGSSPTR